MVDFWVILLTLLPLSVGAGLGSFEFALQLTGHQGQLQKIHRWVMVATLTLSAAGAIGLLLLPDAQPNFALNWLPNTGEMHLSIGQSGLITALVTTSIALGLLVISNSPAPLTSSLLLIACGAANMAFISGHFVARYVALEIAGLCIALLPLADIKGREGGYLSRRVYLMLRLGDAGLLVAILMLMNHTGTLEIATALEKGASAPSTARHWITAGLILAVWVKMGLWPFHNWLAQGHHLSPVANIWGYRAVMPNLGLYLLYRIQPLLLANAQAGKLLIWAGMAAAGTAGILAVYRKGLPEKLTYLLAFQGGVIIAWSTRGQINYIPCLLFMNLLNLSLAWIGTAETRRTSNVLIGLTGTGTLAFWIFTLINMSRPISAAAILAAAFVLLFTVVWTLRTLRQQPVAHPTSGLSPEVTDAGILPVRYPAARDKRGTTNWIYRLLKQDALEILLQGATAGVLGIGRWLYRMIEQDILEQTLQRIAIATLGSGRWLYTVIENASLDGFLHWITRTVRVASHQLQKVHTGKLRLNLLWVILSILVIIVTVVL